MSIVAAYVRVSTVGQNEASQRREIAAWLKARGPADGEVRWYVDKSTGDDLRRPAFEQLQADVFAGRVAMIVVYKLDRISRTLVDGINTLVGWLKSDVRVTSVTQQLDFAGATGQLVAAVLFAVAQMEQETRRERQAAGIAAAKERGVYVGRNKGTTKVSPERVAELRAQGLKAEEIARAMGVSRASVFNYLRQAKVPAPV